jgi:hypothetical protein
MKNYLKFILGLSIVSQLKAQENYKLETILKERDAFVNEKSKLPHPKLSEIKEAEKEMAESGTEKRSSNDSATNIFLWENTFWKENIKYRNFAESRNVISVRDLCANGGFENGNSIFTYNAGLWNYGQTASLSATGCIGLADIIYNPVFNQNGPLSSVPERMEVVNSGVDPLITGLPRTRSGSRALRINSPYVGSGYNNICIDLNRINGSIDNVSTTFSVSATDLELSFFYAAILQESTSLFSHGLNGILGKNTRIGSSFFSIVVTDLQTNQPQVIRCEDNFTMTQNTRTLSCPDFNSLAYFRNWTPVSIDLRPYRGKTIRLEIIAADCSAGAHFGYAYIDDFCVNRNVAGEHTGGVTITSNDICPSDGDISFNGTYTLPNISGAVLQSLTFNVVYNGTLTAPYNQQQANVSTVNNTYFGYIPLSVSSIQTNSIQNIDIIAVAVFSTPNGTIMQTGEIQLGLGNDFMITAASCCDQGFSTLFSYSVNCVNGRADLILFPRTGVLTQQWYLYRTRIANSISDNDIIDANPATPGPDPIAYSSFTTGYTFANIDPTLNYFVKHGVTSNCRPVWRETREAIIIPTYTFQLQDVNGTVKNSFCSNEPVVLFGNYRSQPTVHSLLIRSRPIGSNGLFTMLTTPTVVAVTGTLGTQSMSINLSALLQARNPPILLPPGFEYSITDNLEIPDNNCFSRNTYSAAFTVSCCTTGTNNAAAFRLNMNNIGTNTYTITSTNSNTLSSVPHIWTVHTSNSPTGGPFTFVAQYTTATLNFTPAQTGIYYHIVHKITDVCGEQCYSQSVFAGAPLNSCAAITQTLGICNAPINLKTVCKPTRSSLFWDAVAGINSYDLEITFDDLDCCKNTSAPASTAQTIRVNGTSYTLSQALWSRCFSWRVASVCGRNSRSAWSVKQCANCNPTVSPSNNPIGPTKVGSKE